MKKTKIYVDTSVLTDAEIEDAPEEVKNIYAEFRSCAESILELSPETIGLADAYLNHGILTQNYRNDAGLQIRSEHYRWWLGVRLASM